MQSRIFSKIRTTRDLEKLSEEIETLLSSIYTQKGGGFESALKSKVRAWVAEEIKMELKESGLDKVDYLNNLLTELKSFKILRLDLAFEPSYETIERIHSFIFNNFGKKILIDLNHVYGLVGGARIIFEGKYFDYSLKKAFEREFAKEKDEILQILNL